MAVMRGRPQQMQPIPMPCAYQPVRNVQAGVQVANPQVLRPAQMQWINQAASFTAPPPGYIPPSPMQNVTYSTVPATGSAAAPPGGTCRCQVRVAPRMSTTVTSQALTSPRQPGGTSKAASPSEVALSKTSRMRYSSGGRGFENPDAKVTSEPVPLTASKPMKPGSRCYRSSSCSSSLDGSPRRKGAFERAQSAGVRMETPGLARGATASSSALLMEQDGPVRRSSAGAYSMARQRSGRRPGSKSPPRNAQAAQVSRRPSGGPPSSRGTQRKSAVQIAVTGTSQMASHPSEPEAEAEPQRQEVRLSASEAAQAARQAQAQADIVVRAKVEAARGCPNIQLRACLLPSEIIHQKDVQCEHLISQGSFGQVFLARLGDAQVCVKQCILQNGAMTPEQLRNMERELNSYRRLKHPNIVRYIGAILEYPCLAIVTEYLSNGNLFDLLYCNQINLKSTIRLRIAMQTTGGIHYMHQLSPPLIHRDLKTQNLVLDEHFNIKVCDFGKTQEMEADGVPITHQDTGGSPRYMAPESFTVGARITQKVDIWSLGCCLVEIFGGPLPYEDKPQMSEVQDCLKRGIPPMVPPWFTPNVQPMLRGCFQFKPEWRARMEEIENCLRTLTPQELDRYGMTVRRTNL